ncbi:hypothetical protein [Nostoc sp. CCY0012]|uniref:hypothetical protein n=1 Tax=Nostoc sp. CCY0012 TaxID=1056123 RepID=UPI0039C689D6
MSMKRHTPRNFHNKPVSASTPMLKKAGNLGVSGEQQFMQMLEHLVTATSKEDSNNVALVVIAAMFFGFLVFALRPVSSPVSPPQITIQSHPITTITTKQQQSQSQSYNSPEAQQIIADPGFESGL